MAPHNMASLHGPIFGAPKKLSKSPVMKEACSRLTELVRLATETGTSAYGPFDGQTTSFSIEFYTAHDDQPLLQYHHTAPSLAHGHGPGTNVVNSDTIYRIGSITKVVTVFLFLVQDGYTHFNDSITRYVPELRDAAQKYDAALHPIDHVAWEEVTVGALAGHMAGIGSDCKPFNSNSSA